MVVGIIAVPFARKQQNHGAGFYFLLFAGLRGEVTASFGDVDQLVFVQDTPSLRFKIIRVRMFGRRIDAFGRNELIADRCDHNSPFFISCANRQILQLVFYLSIHISLSELKGIKSFSVAKIYTSRLHLQQIKTISYGLP